MISWYFILNLKIGRIENNEILIRGDNGIIDIETVTEGIVKIWNCTI